MYRETKWLNSYATINELATKKIMKEFMHEYFDVADNVLEKNIDVLIEAHHFKHRKNISMLTSDITLHVAAYFSNGNETKAKSILNGDENKVPRGPLIVISFFGGGIVISSVIMLMLIFDEVLMHDEHDPDLEKKFDAISNCLAL